MSCLNTASKIGVQTGAFIQPGTEALDPAISDEAAPPDDGSSFVIAKPGGNGLAILGRCMRLAVTAPFWMMMGTLGGSPPTGAEAEIETQLAVLDAPVSAGDYEEKQSAARFLADHKIERAIPSLLKWAYHTNERVNECGEEGACSLAMTAVSSLARIGSQKAIEALDSFIRSEEERYPDAILRAIHMLGLKRLQVAVPTLQFVLFEYGNDEDRAADYKISAVEALGHIGTPAAMNVLLDALSDTKADFDAGTMAAIIRLLARLRVEAAIPGLKVLAISVNGPFAKRFDIAEEAVRALPQFEALGRYILAAEILPEAKSTEIAGLALELLAQEGLDDVIPHLERLVKEESNWRLGLLEEEHGRMDLMIEALQHADSPAAKDALQRIGADPRVHERIRRRTQADPRTATSLFSPVLGSGVRSRPPAREPAPAKAAQTPTPEIPYQTPRNDPGGLEID